jgi:catechol 2,3-dioxygenase-like lactoylglutathione lyase family enzyme
MPKGIVMSSERDLGQDSPAFPRLLSACISVADVKRCAQWYVDRLGFEVVRWREFTEYAACVAYLRCRDLVLELVQTAGSVAVPRPGPPRHGSVRGISQITFYVVNIGDARNWVKERGLVVVMETVTVSDLGVSSFFIEDIEGNLIEFSCADWLSLPLAKENSS